MPAESLDNLALSEQEKHIATTGYGEEYPFFKKHRRFFKIYQKYVDGVEPYVDIYRAMIFTRSMRNTEEQPIILRYALALKDLAEQMPVYIDEDQLIVGRLGTDKGRYGILYPEVDGDSVGVGLDAAISRTASPLSITTEDIVAIRETIVPYWSDKTFHSRLVRSLPEEVRKFHYGSPDGSIPRNFVAEQASMQTGLQWIPDYSKILSRGVRAIRQEAEEKLRNIPDDNPSELWKKKPFYEAVIISCDALVTWARRHAELAEKLADTQINPVREKELREIAKNCRRVPEYPAENFWQALQAQWFYQAFSRLERRTGGIIGNGRMDQYLYSFYKKDKEEGRLDDDRVLELLDCLWLQMAQFVSLTISPQATIHHEGYAHWEALTVGGQNADGEDATNELSYLILRSKRETPLQHPDLAARVHSRSPERFLWAVAETIKIGQGFPKIYNDEEIIPLYMAKGAPASAALDYAASGCVEARMPNIDTYTSLCTLVNCAAAVELTMRNGGMKKYGTTFKTFESGTLAELDTWEKFWNAYKRQLQFMVRQAMFLQYRIERVREQVFACPLEDAVHDLSMKYAIDLDSTENIPGGVNLGYYDCLGFGTAIDSLAAVKQFVYEEKLFTLPQLLKAMDLNFKGHEQMRRILSRGHCYGNNDPYADRIGKDIEAACQEVSSKYVRQTGVNLDLRMVSITANVPFGKEVCATPNGRLEWMPVSEGSSACQGADVHGPTAVLLSNHFSKNWASINRGPRLLNIKFTPKSLEGDEGTRRLIGFLRAFCDLKIWHVQFNVVNKSTLLAAQKEPQKYRNLMVRVAGYSAFFVDLSASLQNDIISRTSHDSF